MTSDTLKEIASNFISVLDQKLSDQMPSENGPEKDQTPPQVQQLKTHIEKKKNWLEKRTTYIDPLLMEQSNSESSSDGDCNNNGQLILINVYLQSLKKSVPLSGTTNQSAASLARLFAMKYKLTTREQIAVKKLVIEKINHFQTYKDTEGLVKSIDKKI